jgi:hypothetical protein
MSTSGGTWRSESQLQLVAAISVIAQFPAEQQLAELRRDHPQAAVRLLSRIY